MRKMPVRCTGTYHQKKALVCCLLHHHCCVHNISVTS